MDAKARLLQELDRQVEEKRRELAREGEALAALKRALDAARQELRDERARLEGVKRDVEAAVSEKSKADSQRIEQVAKVYAAMRPREAATALEKMDDEMAASILEKLPGRTVGKLFDAMDKDRVRALTRRLGQGRTGSGGK
ncbi:MAG: hypothetical protein HY900_17940 [Deltaproteobacteria bacterium]|nr:hypothetical protein [Deltaproteobacteria bacterium]